MKRFGVLALVALGLTVTLPALAESYMNKHVRVERSDGGKIVGQVVGEDDDIIKIGRGKTGWTVVPRDEIDKVVNLEDYWQKEIVAKEAVAKTADDWYAIAQALKKENFPSVNSKGIAMDDVAERLKKAIAIDPNHKKARKELGFEERPDEAGKSQWLTPEQAKEWDVLHGKLSKDSTAMEDRSWADYRIVVMKPDKQPEYEIITNLPPEQANDYANFMVDLKKQLVQLIEKQVGKKVAWRKNDCQICKGQGGNCKRCLGSGREPCTIFITNSHKFFMDLVPTPGLGGFYMPGPFHAGDREESYGFVSCSRPIVAFHGQFGTGNTFMVLAHEGTHQLEHLMWKGDTSALHTRPGWLTEGLAVYFGDGLNIGPPDKKTGSRPMSIEVPRDRLAGLRRQLNQGPGKYYPIKRFTSFGIPEFQQDPGLYAYGWSLIYFMLNTKDKFKWNGKEIDLKEAFGKFFMDNCEKGALAAYPQGFLGLAAAMGATSPKEGEQMLDELEKLWKDFILKLPIKSVGDFDPKDKTKKLWVSDELKFSITLPGGKKKSKFDWRLVANEELNATLYEEAMAFTDGNARVIVCVHANSENYDIDDSLEYIYRVITRAGYGRYKRTDPSFAPPTGSKEDTRPKPAEGTLKPPSSLETRTFVGLGEEQKVPGWVDNPRPNKQKFKMMVTRNSAKIYQIICTCDEGDFEKYESEFDEMLSSFQVTGA
ncbi:MAG TPA: DUF1570 domain-containing protein [Planctomycetota bacterium]|nr:DUF1570 domain-containing protein [Planctomycetota bacterium]